MDAFWCPSLFLPPTGKRQNIQDNITEQGINMKIFHIKFALMLYLHEEKMLK